MKQAKSTDGSEFRNLIGEGIEKLKAFGFTNVTKEDILSDEVYFFFLMRFAPSLRGKNKKLDFEIDKFLSLNKEHGAG